MELAAFHREVGDFALEPAGVRRPAIEILKATVPDGQIAAEVALAPHPGVSHGRTSDREPLDENRVRTRMPR